MMTAVANYTTKIKCSKTVGEIQEMLAEHGAETVNIEYRNRFPSAVSFSILVNNQPVAFRLPVDPDAVMVRMEIADSVPARLCSLDQARRVAWRNVRQWLMAQLQFIADGQVTFAQAMLPYGIAPNGRTVYELFQEQQFLLPSAVD